MNKYIKISLKFSLKEWISIYIYIYIYIYIVKIIIIIIIIYSLRVFHISFSWWSFTEVWVTASLLKSPGLYSLSLLLLLLFTPLEFFTLALADGLSLEFEWQQVSSSLQDSSQYRGLSQ